MDPLHRPGSCSQGRILSYTLIPHIRPECMPRNRCNARYHRDDQPDPYAEEVTSNKRRGQKWHHVDSHRVAWLSMSRGEFLSHEKDQGFTSWTMVLAPTFFCVTSGGKISLNLGIFLAVLYLFGCIWCRFVSLVKSLPVLSESTIPFSPAARDL